MKLVRETRVKRSKLVRAEELLFGRLPSAWEMPSAVLTITLMIMEKGYTRGLIKRYINRINLSLVSFLCVIVFQ